jgi:hypothetical protein
MVTEGSVLVARLEPNGAAVDVAPENFAHPVYRSGLALAVELPLTIAAIEEVASERQAVEEPGSEEAVIEAVVPRLEEVPDEPEVAPEAEHVPGEEPPAIESSESVAPEIETPEIETPETETPREDSGDAV